MPIVSYVLRIGEDEFTETETLAPSETVQTHILAILNHNRRKLQLPLAKLVSVTVVNPHVHKHEWHITGKIYKFLYCPRCGVSAIQEGNGRIIRDTKFGAAKYELCRDKLKELPKQLRFS